MLTIERTDTSFQSPLIFPCKMMFPQITEISDLHAM